MINGQFPQQLALDTCLNKTGVDALPEPYAGKVREVYKLNNETIGIVVTDRISAFDHIMKQAIPFKGQILNLLAAYGFRQVADIISNHIIDIPHPNVTIAKKCTPIPIEVVVRGHLTGHAWRTYHSGERSLCGVSLPDGMCEHQPFDRPIITPATKAKTGHDEDISEDEILTRGIVREKDWFFIRDKALRLFEKGQKVANRNDLILVDTKYEFGYDTNNTITLIDEVHTTDSSRYFYAEGFEKRLEKNMPQKQLSKEFLREWLISKKFQGLEGQILPDLPDDFRMDVYKRYKELYEQLTGEGFTPTLLYKFDEQLEEIFNDYISNT